MSEVVAINKPIGPTSHDIVDQIRKITGERRVGHAGTLDPQASGVLVVGIGREATRQLSKIVKKEKEYEAKIFLGQESTTDDSEGKKVEISNLAPSKPEVVKVLQNFTGTIKQVPSAYSAIKQNGIRAYKLARAGKKIELEARSVEIKKIELINYTWPRLSLRIVCGPGVYIRALARDIGQSLECGGYLSALVRIRVGDFRLNSAETVEEFAREWKNAGH